MDTQSAQAEQLPKALRSFIRAGTYVQKVLDTAEVNAQARAAAGQPPNLLDDVMKDGQVHIANLEEVLADITGRTKAKTVVEFMTHAHGLMGIYNSVSDMFSGADEAHAGDPRRASSQASAPANGASSPTFRPEFTGAARRAAKAAAAASAQRPHEATAPAATAHTAPAPETTTPSMSLDDTLSALTMNVARHLQAFEKSVADEQTALRGRMMHQSLEAAGLRGRIQALEAKLMPAARAPASTVGEHAAVPAAAPVTAVPVVEPTAAPVAAPANEPPPHQTANVDPATSDTHGDVVDAMVAAFAGKISDMVLESHTRVQTKLMEDRAQSIACDEELLKLRTAVIRLEGLAENNTAPPPESDGQRLAEGDQGPPSEPRLE